MMSLTVQPQERVEKGMINPKEGGGNNNNQEKLDSSRHAYYVTLSVNYDWVTKFIMSIMR
jgi:hypothetical protein